MNLSDKKIAVLLSGGVDSSVVLYELVRQGLKPDCFYIKIGSTPEATKEGEPEWDCSMEKALFPIGHMMKEEVRQIAEQEHLAPAHRRDSQGICFLGKINYNDYLRLTGFDVKIRGRSIRKCSVPE